MAVQSATASKSTKLAKARLTFIKDWKGESLHYGDQTSTVANIVSALGDPNALKEAFFEGKVYEVFPPVDYFHGPLAAQPTHVVTSKETPLIYDNGSRNQILDLRSGTLLKETLPPYQIGSRYTYVTVVSPGANAQRRGEILKKEIKSIKA